MKDPFRHPATILVVAGATVVVGVAVARSRRKRLKNRKPKKVLPEASGVHLYGAQWCPACMKLKEDLDDREIPFTFHDIDTDTKADTFVMQQSDEGIIPVTTVNGTVFMGYTPDEIENAYRSLLT